VTDCAGYDILPFDERYVPGGIAFVLQYRSVVSVFFVKWICATLQCGACVRACGCVCVCTMGNLKRYTNFPRQVKHEF
jgi:hypothetical protein